MLSRHYQAKDEFELCGTLLKDLTNEDFSEKCIRVFCFAQSGAEWKVVDALITETEKISLSYYQKMRHKHFVLLLSSQNKEVSMDGQQLSIHGHFTKQFVFENAPLGDRGFINTDRPPASKLNIFSEQYNVKTEFELYGELLKVLSAETCDYPMNRVFCFAQRDLSTWFLSETFETDTDEECAEFCSTRIGTAFIAMLGKHGEEVVFHGREFNLLSKFLDDRLRPVDFEDLNPSQAFLDYEKKTLKESVRFLKKILKGD